MDMSDLLVIIQPLVLLAQRFMLLFMLGGATGGCAIFLRALPWPTRWKQRKPLACPACMGGWSAFCTGGIAMDAGYFAGWSAGLLALAWFFLTGLGALMFAYVNPPMIELPTGEEGQVLPDNDTSA